MNLRMMKYNRMDVRMFVCVCLCVCVCVCMCMKERVTKMDRRKERRESKRVNITVNDKNMASGSPLGDPVC